MKKSIRRELEKEVVEQGKVQGYARAVQKKCVGIYIPILLCKDVLELCITSPPYF